MSNVLLGYEVDSGDSVEIPINHMVITGQTQMAGKTSTLEALVQRSGVKALSFITKRGEGGFRDAHRIDPYFREQADWKFVSSILEVNRGEKLKFERAWIIRASKGARTLRDVYHNVRNALKTAKGLSGDVYLTLEAYLEDVLPSIDKVQWAKSISLDPGINVMDLTKISAEMQHLVIKSSIDWVLEHENNTVVVIPEAWKFIPQGRGTPVKLSAESYIRQAAGLGNYLWLDSQDIAGVEKIILKSIPLWILGVQREANEIKRTLSEIPAGIKRPRPENIAQLELGQFFACWGKHVRKTYVQPVWLTDEQAKKVAMGEAVIEQAWVGRGSLVPNLPNHFSIGFTPTDEIPDLESKFQAGELTAEDLNLGDEMSKEAEERIIDTLDKLVDLMANHAQHHQGVPPIAENGNGAQHVNLDKFQEDGISGLNVDALYKEFIRRMIQDKTLIKLAVTIPTIEIETVRPVVEMGDDLQGWLVRLISEGFFDKGANGQSAFDELIRRGKKVAKPSIYTSLRNLAGLGALTIERQGKSELFLRNPDLQINRRNK